MAPKRKIWCSWNWNNEGVSLSLLLISLWQSVRRLGFFGNPIRDVRTIVTKEGMEMQDTCTFSSFQTEDAVYVFEVLEVCLLFAKSLSLSYDVRYESWIRLSTKRKLCECIHASTCHGQKEKISFTSLMEKREKWHSNCGTEETVIRWWCVGMYVCFRLEFFSNGKKLRKTVWRETCCLSMTSSPRLAWWRWWSACSQRISSCFLWKCDVFFSLQEFSTTDSSDVLSFVHFSFRDVSSLARESSSLDIRSIRKKRVVFSYRIAFAINSSPFMSLLVVRETLWVSWTHNSVCKCFLSHTTSYSCSLFSFKRQQDVQQKETQDKSNRDNNKKKNSTSIALLVTKDTLMFFKRSIKHHNKSNFKSCFLETPSRLRLLLVYMSC